MKVRVLLGVAVLVGSLLVTGPVRAQEPGETDFTGKWKGACVGAKDSLAADVATIQGVQCLIANGLNAVLTLFSFVGFAMFCYGAFMLLISSGQPSHFEKARNTFMYAVLGFVLALSSFVIIQILGYYTGISSFMTIKFFGNTLETTETNK